MKTSKEKTLGVVIGRFSMVHNEHVRMLEQMANENTHVIVLVGSANRRKSNKNPFDFLERRQVLENVLALRTPNYAIVPLSDMLYSETRWEARVQERVKEYAESQGIHPANISLYGQDKDHTTYYLKSFPQWQRKDFGIMVDIDATRLREIWFVCNQGVDWADSLLSHYLPPQMLGFLKSRPFDERTQADWQYYRDEAEKFKDYPYPETLNFVCGDAVIECAGHILTVTRAAAPGLGCRALPGGFKNRGENTVDTAIREAYEETNLRIQPHVLRNCIRGHQLFDHPSRSNGLPRVTYATHFKLEPSHKDGKLPRARGGDDAKATWLPNNGVAWTPINDILSGNVVMYDDHQDIVEFFLK